MKTPIEIRISRLVGMAIGLAVAASLVYEFELH